jgi:hypothetical protein
MVSHFDCRKVAQYISRKVSWGGGGVAGFMVTISCSEGRAVEADEHVSGSAMPM